MNTLAMGLPQNRPRLYIWGVREDLNTDLPDIPTGHLGATLDLKDILGNDAPKEPDDWPNVQHLVPKAAADCARRVAQRWDTKFIRGGDWMVDEQISRARQSNRNASPHFPCLLQTRKHPPWVGSRMRRATLAETRRAQGLLPSSIHAEDWEHPIDLCRMLGNTMSANVLLRLLEPLINAVRPEVAMTSPWAT